jgi:ubiquinone/menaquinone biosynthesis C-methylase UbiE
MPETSMPETRMPDSSRPSFQSWLVRRLLGLAFELLYHELAPVYDLASWAISGGRWREWQLEALRDLPGGRILEVGPGTGQLLQALLAAGRDAFGVELSPAMLAVASRRRGGQRIIGRLVRGEARRLPFRGESFDGVVLTFPSPYIGGAFWAEVERVLRPGGRLVVLLNAESGHWPWPGALEWALARLTGGGRSPDEEIELTPRLRGRYVERSSSLGTICLVVAGRQRAS